MGGQEDVDYTTFAEVHVQDWAVAERIAQAMLEGEDPYEIDDDYPQVFTVLDEDELRRQMNDD
jgi:hypothetical protein